MNTLSSWASPTGSNRTKVNDKANKTDPQTPALSLNTGVHIPMYQVHCISFGTLSKNRIPNPQTSSDIAHILFQRQHLQSYHMHISGCTTVHWSSRSQDQLPLRQGNTWHLFFCTISHYSDIATTALQIEQKK